MSKNLQRIIIQIIMPEMSQDNQIPQTLASLKRSKFRSKFKLTEKDRQYIQDKGIDTIREHAIDFIKTRIAPQNPKNDGKQTPMRGRPVFVAQHATGTCCRICIEKWHGIKKGRELSDQEIQFLVELIMGWIEG
jgi:exodeoxyribonuclease V alpha subunit